MGSTLGCVRKQQEAAEADRKKTPFTPRKKVRFKRFRKNKKAASRSRYGAGEAEGRSLGNSSPSAARQMKGDEACFSPAGAARKLATGAGLGPGSGKGEPAEDPSGGLQKPLPLRNASDLPIEAATSPGKSADLLVKAVGESTQQTFSVRAEIQPSGQRVIKFETDPCSGGELCEPPVKPEESEMKELIFPLPLSGEEDLKAGKRITASNPEAANEIDAGPFFSRESPKEGARLDWEGSNTDHSSVPDSHSENADGKHNQTSLQGENEALAEEAELVRQSPLKRDLTVELRTSNTLFTSGYDSNLPSAEINESVPGKTSFELSSYAPDGDTLSISEIEFGLSTSNEGDDISLEQVANLSQEMISEIYVSGESGDMSAKEKLLLWTQKLTEGYSGLKCCNFTSSWSDGKVFNAIIHKYRPDLIDMEKVSIQSNQENLEQAFAVAEALGVTRLLDPEDVDVPSPDEKSVLTYVSSIYESFPKVPEGGEGISANEVDLKWQEYQNKINYLFQWIRQHITLMSDKAFPHNPVELKALYNEYVHFKETELPAKEVEKSQIQHLYKLLEVWIEFGRILLPQGYHPNDVEEEWGKLIIEMLDREKALRPAVERLELLLQIANKIQNGALNCEEKLTLAKNTLQADNAHLESSQQFQYETEVVMYLEECERIIRQLQIDVQILRDENYYQVEQIVMRIIKLQDELVTLRLECTNLYRKGHFISSTDRLQPLNLIATDLTTDVGSSNLHITSFTGFKKPMTRSELIAVSSTQDEGSLRFVYELLAWVEEVQVRLDRAEWGTDLPSVEKHLEAHRTIHAAVEELDSSLKEAKIYEGQISSNFKTSYSDTLSKLEVQYLKLLETSRLRLRHLSSLHSFVLKVTTELIWLNEKEEEELAYDWSDNNPNISSKKEYFIELKKELEQKQMVIKSNQETGEQLSLENHPARQTVEAYSAALQTQWLWVRQLCCCVEQHVKDNTAYFQFLSDVKEAEQYLRNLQETIRRKYKCDQTSSLSKLEDLLQDSMDEKEQLIKYKSCIAGLVGRAKTVVQLKPRNPNNVLKGTIPIKAICDYRQIEITVCKNDECVLEDNSHRTKWKVISPTGNEAMVPSVCFTIPAPNQEAIDTGSRIEQMYQNVMALWHQLHLNMKSVVSWNYLVKDIGTVRSWNKDTFKTVEASEQQLVMKNLQVHYEDFLEDSQESQVFSIADRLRLEEEVDSCKDHYEQLLVTMETEEKDETLSKTCISELQNISLHLQKYKERLIRRLQASVEGDALQESALRMAEQEHMQQELNGLKSDLDEVTKKCQTLFYQSPSAASIPVLRSELDFIVKKMDHVDSLSSIYMDKLKTMDVMLKSSQGAEMLVKMYEMKLSEEDIVPVELEAVGEHRRMLQQWLSDVTEKHEVFSSLEEEMRRAQTVCKQLFELHGERSLDLERCQEKVVQLKDRWRNIQTQIASRESELATIEELLKNYRGFHQSLIDWIEETTAQQGKMEPGKAEDTKILSEQLSQQTALVAEIENNQTKLDECQTLSKQYSAAVKDYELQLMTYRAFVESHQKSPIKRRRIHSSSDVITQEFMDLRTQYTALVTLTTQHVKYISDALRRLEEEEKVVEEEKQEHVEKLKELLGWVLNTDQMLRSKETESEVAGLETIEQSFCEQQAMTEELNAKKDQVAEAIKTAQIFLAKHGHRISPEEQQQVTSQLNTLKETYGKLCDQSAEELQRLQNKLTHEVQRKSRQEQQEECKQKLDEIGTWLSQTANMVAGHQVAVSECDLPALHEQQNAIQALQKDMQSRAAVMEDVIKATEQLLEENQGKLDSEELVQVETKLLEVKAQHKVLSQSAEKLQKQVDSALTKAVQQETEKAKAEEELEENKVKIDSLLEWLSAVGQQAVSQSHHAGSQEEQNEKRARGISEDEVDALGNGLQLQGQSDVTDSLAGMGGNLNQQQQALKEHHEMLLSQQQAFVLATQSAQSFLDKHGHNLLPEEKRQLQSKLNDLKEQYETALLHADTQLKHAHALQEELQKFLKDHGEFEAWLVQSEYDLQELKAGEMDSSSLHIKLQKQKSFSEDVISHKGDLRYITISGQKVLDAADAFAEANTNEDFKAPIDPSVTSTLVKEKLEDAKSRYSMLHSKCGKLGTHLANMLEKSEHFHEVADELNMWLNNSEATAERLLLETISPDPENLQKQLEDIKVLQGDIAEHEVSVEKLQKAANSLMSLDDDLVPNQDQIQQTTDSIAQRYKSLLKVVSEHDEKLQVSIAQSQNVQEGLDNLLNWLEGVEKSLKNQDNLLMSSAAVQDALAQNTKLKQDIASHQSSINTIQDMVHGFLKNTDGATASSLQEKLEQLNSQVRVVCTEQQEKEEKLRKLLPKIEQFEKLVQDVGQFIEIKSQSLAAGGDPNKDIAHFSQKILDASSEMVKQRGDLQALQQLAEELTAFGILMEKDQLMESVKDLTKGYKNLELTIKKREEEAMSCQQNLTEFTSLVESVRKWLKETKASIPNFESALNTDIIEQQIQEVTVLLEDWSAKSPQIQEINHKGTELESLIMEITSPDTTLLTSKPELTKIQQNVADVNDDYKTLGVMLKESQDYLMATLNQMQEVQEETASIMNWLELKEQTLTSLSSSSIKSQAMKEQVEQNKVYLAELEQNSSKIDKIKGVLKDLLKKNPDSPDAKKWTEMLEQIESKWTRANQAITERQQKLEESADLLSSFQNTQSQLSPWLSEKELMMSVLGPLSIDPNMLRAQKQQVQFMLKEFETRKPQYEQLNQAAQGILCAPGDVCPSDSQVREQHRAINDKWDSLTHQLSSRSDQIDQTTAKSTEYQELLQRLGDKVRILNNKLNSQSMISTQPDVVKQQLEEISEIRSELEQQKELIEDAQNLCDDLSSLIGEQYLKDELRKRLDAVLMPFNGLEERAGDRINQLQTTLASSQQFQQTFDELKLWLDGKCSEHSQKPLISGNLATLQSQISEQEEFQKSLNQHSGSYEMILAEGESLVRSAQTGEEKTGLQSQLSALKGQWDELWKQTASRHSKLKDCIQKAQKYRQYMGDLLPWVEECELKVKELEITIDPTQLNSSLANAKDLQHDVDKRRSLLEMMNAAADVLVDSCQVDEDDIRDEKTDINQRLDLVAEQLQVKSESIEEMAQRLKEFQDSLKTIQLKLDGAKQQLEIYDALGSQACSNKNLEKLRTRQEALQILASQVEYLRDLARGLVEDAPDGADSSQLLQQAELVQQEYGDVKQRVDESCLAMENRLQGIGHFQNRIREMFSHLADLDDELDSMSPIGRDVDSLQSQTDDIKQFMSKLKKLKKDIETSEEECKQMLEVEGSPDLQGLKRELEALNKQCGKLLERGRNRQEQVEMTAGRVEDFYEKLKELNNLLTKTEEGEELQGNVGTEVDIINQQLADFKTFQKVQVDPIQYKLQQANGAGQGLIQSAAKNTNTQGLEHDLDETNTRWNTLNKKVAERISQLQEALLHRGKFQDALEPLLSWLTDTEELIANQKPPSAEYKVVKAQIQEQKLLQRLLDDRRSTVDIIKAEGERIAESAETAERDKIQKQLQNLRERWDNLLSKAGARQKQLEDILVIAKQFHETAEPLNDWLTSKEKKLANSEPVGTQTAKIQQQITRHKALNDEIISRKKNVDQAVRNGQALLKQTTGEEVIIIQEKLDGIKSRYAEITTSSSRALKTLEQVLQLATKFQAFNEELCSWLDSVEAELAASTPQSPIGEQIPQLHERQKELKKEVMEYRLVLDTINEVSNALLELVPWRAREGLDRQVAEANERYRTVSDTVTQKVEAIDAAIQRSQQYEQATDSELTWVAETVRKLTALGPIRLEQDQTTAQLQVQKAFTIDIIRHKDSIDELVTTQDEILSTCGDEQKTALQEKMNLLQQQYEMVSQMNTERYSQLERAHVLINQFWETYEELCPWLDETRALIAQLPPPAVDHEILKQQQEEMRQLRESISEHKPHIDKLMKIGPQLMVLNSDEGKMVHEKHTAAEALYAKIKHDARERALALDEAISQSAQFHDKIDPMLESLGHIADRVRMPPSIPAEVEKIREHISENKNIAMELEKLQPSFEALKRRGEELISRSSGAEEDPAAKAIQDKLNEMVFYWEDIKARGEERDVKLLDVLDLAEKFWYDMAALMTTIKDTQEIVRDLESPGIDPSIIKQQQEAAETIKEETDGLHEELEFVRILGADLIFACGELEKPEVKKSIDELNNTWDNLNKTWKERMDRLEEAMQAAVQYQDALQAMFDWLDNTVIKLGEMSPVGTDISTVKQQINEMKEFKMEVYQQQIEMEKLNHQGELLLKKASDETDQDIIQQPLNELQHLWEDLGEKIINRQHKVEGALLALGQFQHALAELMTWLNHTEELLDGQRPITGDPKAIEIELAKHHVLKNDVLAHKSTVDTVNKAGNELLESSAGEDANNLKHRLDTLNQSWQNLLRKTEGREQQLEAALQQAEGFHGEIEDFLQWLSRVENQLAVSKSTGGLPETAREQLNAHLDLYGEFCAHEETYKNLHDKGRLLLSSRDDASGSNVEQCVALLEQKWQSMSTKMEERKTKLEEALNLATEFQNSLQDFINWLTQAEQSLNIAAPPSLILDTVLFQMDEHKIFANEVNSHRDQIIDLDKTGNQLKFLSQKQDVVLIKNLLFSVQSRWEKVVQRSVERGRALDEARKRAKQFYEAWKKLIDWLEEAENNLDTDLEISNDPDKIKLQLTKHKDFQKTLGGKQPVYDTTIRMGRSMKDKASHEDDRQKLDNLLGEVRDKWDTVCGKSVERQHKLEEALLFSGQFTDALQALVDWLYKVEPQLAEDQPVHGDLDLVMNLMDAHKVFQKELGKRTGSVQVLKRSARELIENSHDDTTWVKVQLQELSIRWDTVCKLSVSKQTRLEQALKQAEEFRNAVHMLLEWLSEAEQSLRFRGVLPDDVEALQSLIDLHKEFMKKVEEKRVDVNKAAGMGEAILAVCHPDCVTTVKHWITIIRARFEEVLTWAKQHQQRLASALSELVTNAELLEELLAWLQWAETTLIQRDQESMPKEIEQVKAIIAEHQSFMEEMTRKQPDVDKVTKTYKRKAVEPAHVRGRKPLNQMANPPAPTAVSAQTEAKNPQINLLSGRWQQVWLLALERQRKLHDCLDRLEELKEFANFDFDVWRKKYMRWMNHKKSRVMDFFRRIDKDQDGKITRQEFIDGILSSKFPTSKLEMTAVADIFDGDGDGYIDYYEFVAALHPNKDAYRPVTDADKIEDEVTRQVAQCKCAKRFQVEQIGENKYRFFLGNQFGDSQQLRLVRILRSTVMVRVGGGWMALDEFLVKNDPCRARGRTNLELREKFILPEGTPQGMAPFRIRGRKSKPSSRAASPTRSSSSASHSNHSCTSVPSSPAAPASGNKVTPVQGSKLRRPSYHSSKASLSGDNGNVPTAKSSKTDSKRTPSRPTSRAGSRAGSRANSRRGSDASDFDVLETQSMCSDISESSTGGSQASSRRGSTKPSKIPTPSKKTTTPKTTSTRR